MSISAGCKYMIDRIPQVLGRLLAGLTMCELGNQRFKLTEGDIKHLMVAKTWFTKHGVKHTSLDLNGQDGALVRNLSEPLENWPQPSLGNFDVVTNFGTSEHCSNQYQVYRNIHLLTKPGGIMIHSVPQEGSWRGHSPYHYLPSFYEQLAGSCGYRIVLLESKPRLGNLLLNCMLVNEGRPFVTEDRFTLPCHSGKFRHDNNNTAERPRKIFIDLGSHNGNSLKQAIKQFADFDLFIGYEPFKPLFDASLKALGKNKRVQINNYAVDVQLEPLKTVKFYEDGNRHKLGCTLYKDKIGKYTERACQSIPVQKVFEQVKAGDHVVLKIDVEGKEYDILEHLLDTGLIKLVSKLYCEWHQHKIPSIPLERHQKLVERLQAAGFAITGSSSKDQYYVGL